MRRPGKHAVMAAFRPVDDRTRAVLRQGKPASSIARFTRTDMAPTSLLMGAHGPDDDLVRVELLTRPEQTKRLPQGAGFELVAGNELLGTGTILSGNGQDRIERKQLSPQKPFAGDIQKENP